MVAQLAACGSRVNAFDTRDGALDGTAVDAASEAGAPQQDAARDVVVRDAAPLGPTDMVITDLDTEIGCARDQWCWESPIPQGEAAFAGFAFAENDQWIFGGAGMALHYDGTSWTRVPTGTRAILDRAWGSAPDDLWVSGYRSNSTNVVERVLLRWNGTAFAPAPALPEGVYAREVHGSARDNVWVIAGPLESIEASIYRFDGSAWREVPADTMPIIPAAIFVESPTRVWLTLSANAAPTRTRAMLFNGADWSAVGSADALGYTTFRRNLVRFDGALFALATGGGGVNGVLRIDEAGVYGESAPVSGLNYQASLVTGGGSMWLLPGTSANPQRTVYRRRSRSSAWTSAVLPAGENTQVPTVLVSGSAAGAWMSNVYADLYRLSDGSGAGTIAQVSPSVRPRTVRFAGRAGAPIAAVTLGDALLQRDAATARWRTSAPFATALVQAAYLPDGTLAFGIAGESVQRFVGAAPAGAPFGTGFTNVFARSADDAIAVGSTAPHRWNGSTWTALPALPAMAGTLALRDVAFDSVWMDADDIFVAGGVRRIELENDRIGVLCRLRASAWTCVTASRMEGGPSSVNGLERGDDGALYALVGPEYGGGRLFRIDRESLAFSEITFNGERIDWSYFSGNANTGALVLGNLDVLTIRPRSQRGERYSVPVSGYASHHADVHVGDDGTLWLLRENTEVLRLEPTIR